MKNTFVLLTVCLCLCACGLARKRELDPHLRPENEAKKLDITLVPQGQKLCGPSVLKMATQRLLPAVPLETFTDLAFTEKARGTFKQDMVSSVRRLGLAPYMVNDFAQMFSLIEAEIPVMVFQNLGFSWSPRWHYALLVGYNREEDEVYLHSGQDAYQKMGFAHFEHTWELGGRWSYIVMPPGEIPGHARFDEALDNAMVFESLRMLLQAERLYYSMSQMWPDRFEPNLGLANVYYMRGERHAALRESLRAKRKNPNHPALLFNLAVLYKENGDLKMASEMKRMALARAPKDQHEQMIQRLGF